MRCLNLDQKDIFIYIHFSKRHVSLLLLLWYFKMHNKNSWMLEKKTSHMRMLKQKKKIRERENNSNVIILSFIWYIYFVQEFLFRLSFQHIAKGKDRCNLCFIHTFIIIIIFLKSLNLMLDQDTNFNFNLFQ